MRSEYSDGSATRRMLLLGALALLLSTSAPAQQQSSAPTDLTKPPGFISAFPLDGIDAVNSYNGKVSVGLPLSKIGARGGANYHPTLAITRSFVLRSFQDWVPAGSSGSWSEPRFQPISENYMDSYDFSNFRPGLLPGVMFGRKTRDRNPSNSGSSSNDCYALVKLYFRIAGGEIELRDVGTNGEPVHGFPGSSFNRNREFHTVDGSGMSFLSDANILDVDCGSQDWQAMNGGTVIYPTGYLMMKDGTRYRFVEGMPIWMRDRNGNYLTFTASTVNDSIGRTYQLGSGVTYKDHSGTNRTVSVVTGALSSALRSDLVAAGVTVKAEQDLFPTIGALLRSPTNLFDPIVTKAVQLPNGLEYKFFYNEYGELASIVLPTGWVIKYEYAPGPGTGPGGVTGSSGSPQVYRVATERSVWDEFGNRQSWQKYEYLPNIISSSDSTIATTVTSYNSANTVLSRKRHHFKGSPSNDFHWSQWYQVFDNGREIAVEMLDASGQTVLNRVENTWKTLDLAGNPTSPPQSTWTHPTNFDCALTEVKTTLSDTNQVSKTTFAYDGNGNQTEVYQYDFGPPNSGTAGSLLVRTHSEFNSSATYVATSGPHILDLLTRLWVSSDAAGVNKVSQTEYEYDNYSVEALVHRANIAGLCLKLDDTIAANCLEPSDTAYILRGNLTKVTAYYDLSTLAAVRTSTQYDIAGNAVKQLDGRAIPTYFIYADSFGFPDGEARGNSSPAELNGRSAFAFVTALTNSVGHTSFTQYNYYRGLTVDNESPTGLVSTAYYNDLLDRPTQVVRATNIPSLKQQKTFLYDDVARTVTTKSDQNTFDDNALTIQTRFDGLGRVKESRGYETPTEYISTLTEYDGLGRVHRVSNPYRPLTAPPEDLFWTTTEYDLLGRIKRLTNQDGTQVNNEYEANRVLVTDQAGQRKMSEMDALGRLVKLWEIRSQDTDTVSVILPASQSAFGYLTTYDYDAKGKLVRSTQGQQQRFFAYDALGRMIRARDSEQGTFVPTTSFPTFTDPNTGQSQWSTGQSFDDSSNLTKRIDARGVVTERNYDDLNRVIATTYSNGTPTVTLTYDAAGVNSTGQLTSVSSSVSTNTYNQYDPFGRVTTATQSTNGSNYSTNYTYDLAGNLKSQTYPSGRIVVSDYDSANRLSGVKNQASGAYYVGAPSTDSINRLQYSAHGATTKMRLGNGLWEHFNFNSRLQPIHIGLGTAGTNSSILQLDFGYGTTANNGNVLSQTITIPGLTLAQAYSYDQLNRLETANEGGGASWKQKFLYDRYGNRRIDTNSANTTPALVGPNPVLSPANNRITPQSGEQYQYDAAGNLTVGRDGETYVFDAENRMTSFNGGAEQGGASYSYDGDGKRVKKVFGTVTTVFVYDVLGRMVAEYSSALPETNGTRYLTSDHLGSSRVVTDSNGAVKARYDYLPFGQELFAGTGGRTTGQSYLADNLADNLRQKFTSKERDKESGLDYFLARYYSASQGRFTAVDPLRASAKAVDPQTWNRYAYVLNRPMIAIDPDGLSVIIVVVGPRRSGGSGNASTLVMDRRGALVPVGRHGKDPIPGLARGKQSDRTKQYADTPFGVYSIYRDGRSDTDSNGNHTGTQGGTANSRPRGIAFGTGIIYMKAEAGEVVQSNRDTIYFHGGGTPLGSHAFDPNQPLVATHGCIRLHNEDVNALIQTVNALEVNGDPVTGIFVGDAATLYSTAAQTDRSGAYLYPELRLALGIDQPPPPPPPQQNDDED